MDRARLHLDSWTLGGLSLLPVPLVVRIAGLDGLAVRLCLLKLLTGIPCPTCGSTRALGRLAALDLTGALSFNPAVTFLWLALVVLSVSRLLTGRPRRPTARLLGRCRWQLGAGLAAVLLLNWSYLVLRGV
jgi:hypothetical protein